MARFKVVTTETRTIVHYVEAETEQEVWDTFNDSSEEGEEVDFDYQMLKVEEVKED